MSRGRGARRRAGERVRPDILGFVLVIVSAWCYSLLPILGKIAFGRGLGLTSMLAVRFTLAAMIMAGSAWFSPPLRRGLRLLPRRRILGLVAWGAIGLGVQSALFFSALRFIPAGLTEVLLYTMPAFLALIVWTRTGRPPSRASAAAIILALAGTWISAGLEGGGTSAVGVALALLAAVWYASFMLWLHRLSPGIPAVLAGTCVIAGAALSFDVAAVVSAILFPEAAAFGLPRDAVAWSAVLGMAVVPTIFGFVLWVAGMKRIGPQKSAVLSTFEPIGTLVLAALVLGERLRPGQWCGAALVIVAAFVLAARGEPDDSAAAPAGPPGPAPEGAARLTGEAGGA